MIAEMAQARAEIASTPAAVVVANHAMGLYELAAIHLSQQPPNLAEAGVGRRRPGRPDQGPRGPAGRERGHPEPGPQPAPDGLRRADPATAGGGERAAATRRDDRPRHRRGRLHRIAHGPAAARARAATSSSSTRWRAATARPPSARPLVVGDIADADLVRRTDHRARGRQHRPLRRLQGGRRVDGGPRQVLRQQRGQDQRPGRRGPHRRGRQGRVLLVLLGLRHPPAAPGGRGPPLRPREPLRREQAHRRAHARAGTASSTAPAR